MARFSYTVYKNSVLATIISFLAGIMSVFGIFMAVGGLFSLEFSILGMGVILFVVFGIGGNILAEMINTYQSNVKWWKNAIKKQGFEERITSSVDLCFQVYNANPCQWTLNKIRGMNPEAAAQIQQALANKK